MRFAADGPDIPNDLLLARDQGRVVFFCGAGVSRARANLPDFFGLAEKVISSLGVSKTSAAYKLIAEARHIEDRIGVPGLISADRIFGLLERDFLTRDIEEAVAKALQPASECDISAHEILLDLATSYDGSVRLVTTNFDRLFDECRRKCASWQPPRLPDPSRTSEMNGIVYLHGKATAGYDGAEDGNFVLSSSQFGRAYLSDGWATSFFKDVIQQYVVVFVGYAADDPPVQYLLEALNAAGPQSDQAYAFQAGSAANAGARWRHKGVQAISYDDENAHGALWLTLKAWAERARDVDGWYTKIIIQAQRGPAALSQHERGQVAHVVSTYEGVKRFARGDAPPPAEWLCVFDPARRYSKPARVGTFREQGPFVDPFDVYGLDSDLPPKQIDPQDYHAKREVPSEAWNAFAITPLDQLSANEKHLAAARGANACSSPHLVSRLAQIGIWLSAVAWQPAAIWWASHQRGLHEEILHSIAWRMGHVDDGWTTASRAAWLFLFETWEGDRNEFNRDWFELESHLSKDGWDLSAPRRYARVLSPYFEMGFNYRQGPIPPAIDARFGVDDLIQRDVKYPDRYSDIQIPDAWVGATVKALRQNLERATDLENELGGYGLTNITPIVADDQRAVDENGSQIIQGLSGAVIHFTELFSRFVILDPVAAKGEFQAWPTRDDGIFARLRIWAADKSDLISPSAFEGIISSLSETAFWNAYHQRDLLLVLAHRWKYLPRRVQQRIEKKLLRGPLRWDGEPDREFSERRAMAILSRLSWLAKRGVSFTQNLEAAKIQLQIQAPHWKPEYSARAADSMESRSGWVRTETNYRPLLGEPLCSLLAKAKDLSQRSELLVENDPFAGLVTDRPVRAFLALLCTAKAGEFPEWAWRRFLAGDARKKDGTRLVLCVATRLIRFRANYIAPFIHPAADWFVCVARVLATERPSLFDETFLALIEVLKLRLPGSGTALSRGGREPDWAMEALNSPAGKLARALFDDPRKNGLVTGACFPPIWTSHVEALLALENDQRRQAMVIFLRNLDWFHSVDPLWTMTHLLPFVDTADFLDRDAAWAGLFWGARIPNRSLYMRLKPAFISAVSASLKTSRHENRQILAGILLAGWASLDPDSDEQCISDDEMRTVLLDGGDDFRSAALWQATRWAEAPEEDSPLKWGDLLLKLIEVVWPRHASAKTARMSGRLCDLAFSNAKRFPKIAPLILPLLVKADLGAFTFPHLHRPKDGIVQDHPQLTLAILHAVLPDNASVWPYRIDEMLQQIAEADGTLLGDPRLVGLKRRWDAR